MSCNHYGEGVKHKGKQRGLDVGGESPASHSEGAGRAGEEGTISEKVKAWALKAAEAWS